jgi:hypothetical protein
MKHEEKKDLSYVPGAGGDGFGFFPVITCQLAGKVPKVLWVVHHRRGQRPTLEEAIAAAEDELALAFRDRSLVGDPVRFLDHLRQRGFSDLTDYRVAEDGQDRRDVLGDEYEPAFGDAAARHDPVVHATVMKAVDQQLAENEPPETRETFERLLAAGYSPEYIRRMIGLVFTMEMTESAFVRGTPFDMSRYIENLRRLPQIPPI